jgi:hypothetical protein
MLLASEQKPERLLSLNKLRMLMRMKICTSIVQTLFLVSVIVAGNATAQQTNKIGTAAATFLRIPVGARAIGMGDASVSIMDDPASAFWNPSLLSTVKTNALIVDHSRWLPGVNFDFAAIVLLFQDAGTVGLSTTILHTDPMEVTTPAEQMGTGEMFTASSLAIAATYSRSLTDQFSVGGTFKYIHETIWDSYASGIAFDIGTIFVTPFEGIRLGASISNFGTKMQMDGDNLNFRADIAPDQEGNNQSVVGKLSTDAFDLPLVMRVGISGEVIKSEQIRLTLSADAVNPNDNAQSANIGAELGLLNELIILRSGYRDLFLPGSEFGSSFGVGLNNLTVANGVSATLEYAFQQYRHLGDSNRFTLGIRF